MTTEVDYSSEICEGCGIVLHFGDDPSVRPRHLCGEAALQVAFAIWIQYRVQVADHANRVRYSRWSYPSGSLRRGGDVYPVEQPSLEEFKAKASEEAWDLIRRCGIDVLMGGHAQGIAKVYTDDDARRLNSLHCRPGEIEKHYPKIADVLKEYFITEIAVPVNG